MDNAVRVHRLRGTLQRFGALHTETERPHAPPFADPELLLGLRRVVAQERPDIIHAHNWLLHSLLPLKPFLSVPLVVTLHDYSFICARKDFMHQGQSRCSGPGWRKCLACAGQHYHGTKGHITALANWANRLLERRLVDMFLAVSPAVARLNGLPHADVPFDIIPNFVPDDIAEVSADADHPELASLPEQYILFVGDLCSMKGVNILLEAYRRLPAPPPLVLIGRRLPDTPTAVPPNVFIFEKWPHAAVLHAWKRCLFGVAPSILNEACATVVMEAMAFGKPMVVTGVGGMPELVEHGKTGLIVEPHAASLQDALALLLADAALRARMGAASLGKSETLKATVVASRIEDAYRSLLARPRVRARRQFGTGATAPFRR